MELEIKKLDWDTDYFGFPVQLLELKEQLNNDFVTTLAGKVEKLCYVYSENEIHEKDKFSYHGTKVVFEKKCESSLKVQTTNIQLVDQEYFDKHSSQIMQLAFLSGQYSRFNIDPNFNTNDFERLYDIWIEKAINKTNDNLIFVLKKDDDYPIGLLTAKLDFLNCTCTVGLLSVDINFQGKGIGKEMLQNLERICIENKMKTIFIPTQLENVGACKFYKNLGYTIFSKTNIYHFWK